MHRKPPKNNRTNAPRPVSHPRPRPAAGKPAAAAKPAAPRPAPRVAPADEIIPDLHQIDALEPPADFIEQAEALGIAFDDGDVQRLGRYLAMLLKTNERFNLTAITEPAEAWRRHILDALTLLPVIESLRPDAEGERAAAMRIIDVGSGGGVPGLPLACTMPADRFTLLEPTGKKAEFLRRCAESLALRNVDVLCARAEAAAQDHKAYREKFDHAVVRAVGHLAQIAELCCGFVKVGGAILAIKGEKADQEVEESRKAFEALSLEHAETIETPTGRIVVLMKADRTPRTYPRLDGEPKRRPLGLAAPEAKSSAKPRSDQP